jgi:hypothetical protein
MQLIQAMTEEFSRAFALGAKVLYRSDTADKWAPSQTTVFQELGLAFDSDARFPDVILYHRDENRLFLMEAATGHGPISPERREELARLFSETDAYLVYITAVAARSVVTEYLDDVSWETEIWMADNPTHLIHLDGKRFLGPYTHDDDTNQ